MTMNIISNKLWCKKKVLDKIYLVWCIFVKHAGKYSFMQPPVTAKPLLTSIDEDILTTTMAMQVTVDNDISLLQQPVGNNAPKFFKSN